MESGLPPKVEIELAEAVHHLGPADHAAEREPVADALGEGEQVGSHAVRLVAPEVVAGAPPAGLHLVGDEQDAVLVEHLLRTRRSSPSGGITNPPTPWIGSAIMHATSPAVVVASTSRRSSTQRGDVRVVVEPGEQRRAAGRRPARTSTWTGLTGSTPTSRGCR